MISLDIEEITLMSLTPFVMMAVYVWLWYIRIALIGTTLQNCWNLLAGYFLSLSLSMLWVFLLRQAEIEPCFGDVVFLGFIIPLMLFDQRYYLLPDPAVFGLLWLGIFLAYLGYSPQDLDQSILGVIFGYSLMIAIYWLGYWRYRREAIGRGDVKFSAAVGAWIGVESIFNFLFFSALIGLVWAMSAWFKHKNVVKEGIPFGPSLGISGIIFYFIARFMTTY